MEKMFFVDAKMKKMIFLRLQKELQRKSHRIFRMSSTHSGTSSVIAVLDTNCKKCTGSSVRRLTCHPWTKVTTTKSHLQERDSHVIQYNAQRNFSTTMAKLEKEKENKDTKTTDEKDSKEENVKKDSKEENEKKEEDDDIQGGLLDGSSDALIALLVAAACSGFMFLLNKPKEEYSYRGEISWTEFIDMMKKGLVRKVVGNALHGLDSQNARIYLYDEYIGENVTIPSGCWVTLHTDMPFSKFGYYIRNLETENKNANKVILNEGVSNHSMVFLVFLVAYFVVILRRILILSRMQKHIKPNPRPMVNANQSQDNNDFLRFNMMMEEEDLLVDDKPKLKFKDIAGIKEAKVEVMEFVDYLKNPLRYQRLGAKIPHGALLLGPPGCGKTLLAKAVAAEASVPFYSKAGSEFVEIYGGQGASRVREMFEKARANAPCIIFIDELDAVGRSRSGRGAASNSEEEQTLNQLLVEMDGINTTEGVIMLGATNRVDILDKALLRPGRFDRHILIDLPTAKEREELFQMYLAKITTNFSISEYAPRLAHLTPGMSGADIANVCNEAAIYAGTNSKTSVSKPDMDYALQKIIGGTEKRSYVRDAREKKINAYYEAGRAVVSWMTRTSDAILKISIVPRSKFRLGHYQYYKPERDLQTNVQLFEKMCVHLAGSAAEAMVFNHYSSAAAKDLEIVKKLAYLQVREFGMSENVGQISFHFEEGDETMPKPYSKYMENLIDTEVRDLVTKASLQSKKILEENLAKVHKVAKELMERETLSYEDIEKLIGPPPHGSKMPDEYMNIVPLNENDDSKH